MQTSDTVHPAEPPIPAEAVRLPERGFTINRRKALIASLVLWAGFALVTWLVATGRTAAFDIWGLLLDRAPGSRAFAGPPLIAESIRDVTALGGVLLRNLIALGAVAALLFMKLRREAFLFAATVASAWIVNSGLKLIIGRERPQIVPHLMEASGNSFPSGHSFNSAVVYIALALAFASLSKRHSLRYTLVLGAMALAGAIAWSRVLLGVHFPTDVVAGWLGGAGWAFLAAALLYRPARAAADRTAPPERPQG